MQLFYDEAVLYRMVFILLIVLKIFLILSVCMEVIFELNVFGISWVNKKLIQSYTVIIEIDLAASGFMALVNWQENIGFLILSSLINFFQIIYLQNYIFRRDPLYISSARQNLIFRGFILLNYYANIAFSILGEEKYLFIFYSFLSVFLLIWFFRWGHRLYFHELSNRYFFMLVTIFLTVYFSFV
jgi:hypothetical protein